MQTNVNTPNFAQMIGSLNGLTNKEIEKAVKRTISDCKTRGPAQVTKAVTAVYNIKSGDVTAAGKAAKAGANTVGSIKLIGVAVDNVQLVYKGRLLTPTHFSMTPKQRPEPGKKYKVKAAIFKGQKKVLGSNVFLAASGSAGTTQIPFKRKTKKRLPIEAVKTVSIPQMITNEKVSADIQSRMDELLATRLKHNTERLAAKK